MISVAITSKKTVPELPLLTETIAKHVSSLHELSFTLEDGHEENANINVAPICIKLVPLFEDIRHIACPGISISRDVLVKLGALRELQVLSCSIRCDEDSSPSHLPFNKAIFPSLKGLWIRTESVPTFIIDLLKTCKLGDLEFVYFCQLATHPPSSVLRALMKALGTLKNLSVLCLEDAPDFHEPPRMSTHRRNHSPPLPVPLFGNSNPALLSVRFRRHRHHLYGQRVAWPQKFGSRDHPGVLRRFQSGHLERLDAPGLSVPRAHIHRPRSEILRGYDGRHSPQASADPMSKSENYLVQFLGGAPVSRSDRDDSFCLRYHVPRSRSRIVERCV